MGSKSNPIGIEKQGGKIQSLSCVGIASKTTLKTAPASRPGRAPAMPEPAHKDSSGAGADGIGKRNVIESLDELWQRVGIRAMALPKIGRAGAVLADPDDDRHVDRSEAQDLHAWND